MARGGSHSRVARNGSRGGRGGRERGATRHKAHATAKRTPLSETQKMERLAQRRPALFAMLQEQNLIDSTLAVSTGNTKFVSAGDRDDLDIEAYGRKLHIGGKGVSRREALQLALSNRRFVEDGLDYVLRGLPQLVSNNGDDESLTKRTIKKTERNTEMEVDSEEESESEEDEEEEETEEEEEEVMEEDSEEEKDDIESSTSTNELVLPGDDELDREAKYYKMMLDGEGIDLNDGEDDEEAIDEEEAKKFNVPLNVNADNETKYANDSDLEDDSTSQPEDVESLVKIQDITLVQEEANDPSPEVKTESRYIPRFMRKKMEEEAAKKTQEKVKVLQSDEERKNTPAYQALKRSVNGLLNRLGNGNLDSIIESFDELYTNSPRHDVNEVSINQLLSVIGEHTNLLDYFVLSYAGLASAMYRTQGVAFAAQLVQTLVENLLKNRLCAIEQDKKLNAPASTDHSGFSTEKKRTINLFSLLGYLYNLGVVSCILIFDIVKLLIKDLNEVDAELLLKLLKIAGSKIRSDDPAALKDIIILLREQTSAQEKEMSPRMRFMIESLMDLKNNKHLSRSSSKKDLTGTLEQQERLLKYLGNLAKKKMIHVEPLRVSLSDIQEVETRGRWWLVGAAWVGDQYKGNNTSEDNVEDQSFDFANNNDDADTQRNAMMKLARKQHMNTEVRRNIFVTLMTSEDCLDAFTRLQQLDLKGKQEHEILRVVIHCCIQEKIYNKYYTLVAHKFTEMGLSMKITFQYALWDALKVISEEYESGIGEEGDVCIRKAHHLARMVSDLIVKQSLTLEPLKGIDFSNMTEIHELFLKTMFTSLTGQLTRQFKTSNKGLKKMSMAEAVDFVLSQVRSVANLQRGLVFFFVKWAEEDFVPISITDMKGNAVSVDTETFGFNLLDALRS